MEVDGLSQQPSQISSNARTMRAQKSPAVTYLNNVLGKLLPLALSEICEKRPPDPIEELARWLYQWADCELYYYEKAIFAKELQLIALQVEKETSRRLARTYALKREAFALKYLLSNEQALIAFLNKRTLSKLSVDTKGSAFKVEMEAWAKEIAASKDFGGREFDAVSRAYAGSRMLAGSRDFGGTRDFDEDREAARLKELRDLAGIREPYGDDYSPGSISISSDGHIASTTGRRRPTTAEQDEHRKRKMLSAFDEIDSTRTLSRRRGRKIPSEQDAALASESFRQSRLSKKARLAAESEDAYDAWADSYGAEAKLKYGFTITPVRCNWYLAEPNILVCVHPVLGEIRATIPTRTPLANTPEWWEKNEHNIAVMYDHEIYTHPAPHFDDDKYTEVMIIWEEFLEPDNDNVLLDEDNEEDI